MQHYYLLIQYHYYICSGYEIDFNSAETNRLFRSAPAQNLLSLSLVTTVQKSKMFTRYVYVIYVSMHQYTNDR